MSTQVEKYRDNALGWTLETVAALAGLSVPPTTKVRYEIRFRFDLGQAVAPIGELANELNTSLAMAGYSEQVAIVSEFPLSLEVSRELTTDEQEKVKKLCLEQFQSASPTWNVRFVSFYRKSGNVAQSAKQ